MPELLASMHRHRQAIFALLMIAIVVLLAAGRDLYRYGFHRFGGQPPAEAFELAKHGTKRVHVDEDSPPPGSPVPPSEAEASPA